MGPKWVNYIMGLLQMGEINGETVAYLPNSYKGLQGSSLKKTILPVIYFNKYQIITNSYYCFTIFKAITTNGSVF